MVKQSSSDLETNPWVYTEPVSFENDPLNLTKITSPSNAHSCINDIHGGSLGNFQ
jgi:hypothetical protein